MSCTFHAHLFGREAIYKLSSCAEDNNENVPGRKEKIVIWREAEMDGAAGFHSDPPYQPFVIRIVLPSGEAADWRIEDEISFHDVVVCCIFVYPYYI